MAYSLLIGDRFQIGDEIFPLASVFKARKASSVASSHTAPLSPNALMALE
ncbi:MAG: hypothetical protein IIA70_05340 [Proteobacteria bacterium]|nr:hypothetical protein [Pseudomonadota bacterium]